MADQWRKVPESAKRCGVSVRTFREYLKLGMPHIRLPTGTILLKDDDVDAYLYQFAVGTDTTIDDIVDEVMSSL